MWHNATSTHHPTSPLISSPSTNPIGHDLHRHCWVRLNRTRTGYGRFGQQMFRMGLATDPSCSCGCAVQMVHHAIYDCPITKCPGDLTTLDLRARDWLHTTQLNLWHVVHVTRSINQSQNDIYTSTQHKVYYLLDNQLFSILISVSLISLCALQCSGDHRFFSPVNTVSPVHWNAAYVSTRPEHGEKLLTFVEQLSVVVVVRLLGQAV